MFRIGLADKVFVIGICGERRGIPEFVPSRIGHGGSRLRED
jgi:hypothetical protein